MQAGFLPFLSKHRMDLPLEQIFLLGYANFMVVVPGKTVIFTALTTAWLALAVIFAGVFVIEKHDHEHVDVSGHRLPSSENCHICLELEIAQRLIEAFGRLGVSLAVIGFISRVEPLIKPQQLFCSKNYRIKSAT
jgi:predicted transporter